ncbi:MAG: hypothetical protein AAFZ15_20025 [Bacteroidota bacterium]
MLSVSHRIMIGSDIWSSTEHSRLLALHCSTALNIPVNECRITMTYPKGVKAKPGETVEVKLGYENNLELVFTGEIAAADWQTDRVTIYAESAFRRLVIGRLNSFFEKSKAGDIVSAACGELDVPKGKVDNGLDFPAYALGDRQSAYSHLSSLAKRSGFDLFADEKDKLVFSKNYATKSHDFQFGVNILSITSDAPDVGVEGVEVYGESPSSLGEGPTASSWLTKKEVKGTAGSTNGMVHRICDPAARSLESSTQIAQAFLENLAAKKQGVLKTLGAPKVKLGHTAKVSKMPADDLNGSYKITGLEHRIAWGKGWVTILKIESTEGGLLGFL